MHPGTYAARRHPLRLMTVCCPPSSAAMQPSWWRAERYGVTVAMVNNRVVENRLEDIAGKSPQYPRELRSAHRRPPHGHQPGLTCFAASCGRKQAKHVRRSAPIFTSIILDAQEKSAKRKRADCFAASCPSQAGRSKSRAPRPERNRQSMSGAALRFLQASSWMRRKNRPSAREQASLPRPAPSQAGRSKKQGTATRRNIPNPTAHQPPPPCQKDGGGFLYGRLLDCAPMHKTCKNRTCFV